MTPTRLTMIRTIAANCRASARQITGPTAEQLNVAADVIGELIEETTLLDRVRAHLGDPLAHLRLDLNSETTRWVLWTREQWRLPQKYEGATEAEALVAALEAPRG
jgi:hypothetical protein